MERSAIFRVLVLSVVFLFLSGESKLEILTTSNHRLSNYNVVQKGSSRVMKSFISSSISSHCRKSARVAYYVPCRANVHDKQSTKRYRSCFITYNPPQYVHASTFSTTRFFAQKEATQSKSIQQEDTSASGLDSNLPLKARHWFTQLLPEGWCVGVCTDDESSTVSDDLSLLSTIILHPDECQWGLDNIASVTSRTSYYLGRMALRLSLDALLQHESMDVDSQEKQTFCTQLNEKIRSTAINKDSYGRPILPEIISGSISHKGGNAVGLARFRSSWDNQYEMGDIQLGALDANAIQWREECPILEDGEEADRNVIDGIFCASSVSTVRGVGIDLERIDAKRGKRIERKVLTETEQIHLGGLEDIGISSAEEVVLRFSLKESVYKALHPILCQYIGFQEAEITPFTDGTAKVTLNLLSGSHERLGIVVHTASWRKMGDYFLTSASVGVMPLTIQRSILI